MDEKREQHEAALTYLDTGTLALADVLAVFDDLPEESPVAVTFERRRRRRPRVGRMAAASVAVAALAVGALTLGAGVFSPSPPTASAAASPFDNATFRAVATSAGWQCSPSTRHLAACVAADSAFANVDVSEGADAVIYITTGHMRGHAVRIVLVVYGTDAAAARHIAEAKATPSLYPNMRTGHRWMAYSNDRTEVYTATRTLPHADHAQPAKRAQHKDRAHRGGTR